LIYYKILVKISKDFKDILGILLKISTHFKTRKLIIRYRKTILSIIKTAHLMIYLRLARLSMEYINAFVIYVYVTSISAQLTLREQDEQLHQHSNLNIENNTEKKAKVNYQHLI
jgi:hypothetical protein